jgi:hypothetical protein
MTRMLLAVAAAVLVATGCGAAANDPNLAAAAEKTEALGSGRFAGEGTVKQNGNASSYSCAGSADYDRKRVHVRCEYERSGPFEAIAIGNDFYLRGDAALGSGSDKWVKETGTVDEDSSLANFSPQHLFSLLRRSSSGTERIGDEDVRGEAATRYRLTVDCDGAKLECDGTAPVDVWIADDGTVRRIEIGDDDGTATIDFFDFGADVDIEAPAESEIVPGGGLVTGSGGSSSLGPVDCAEGEARPLAQRRVGDALRRHGFSVDDFGCLLGNDFSDRDREGSLTCGVNATPPAGASNTVTRRDLDSDDVRMSLANVECALEPGDQNREAKITRLETALSELAQSIR